MTDLSGIATLLRDPRPLEPSAETRAAAAAYLDGLIAAEPRPVAPRRRRVRMSRPLIALIAAVVVLVAGAAVATSVVLKDASPTRREPVRHVTVAVRHLDAPVPASVRQNVRRHEFVSLQRANERLNLSAGRELGAVSWPNPRLRATTYYAFPLSNAPGFCVLDDQYTGFITREYCTHHVTSATPWVNQAPGPNPVPLPGDQFAIDANQSPSNVIVDGPLRWQKYLYPGQSPTQLPAPVPLWTITGMLPAAATAAELHYQDGSSSPIPLSGRFFFAVVQGAHGRHGARPTSVTETDSSGGVVGTDQLSPQLFNAEQYALARGVSAYLANASDLAGNEQFAIGDYNVDDPGNPLSGTNAYSNDAIAVSTRQKVAAMFGGSPASYPRYSTIVVMEHGQYNYPHGLRKCNNQRTADYPAICRIPPGSYAWMAMVFPAGIDIERSWQSNEMRWIRLAPPGTPLPDLSKLGWVRIERGGPSTQGKPYNHCCGNPPTP